MLSYQKNFLVTRWNDRRENLKALVTLAEAHREKEIYVGWTLREFLAHMSGWDDAVLDALRSLATSQPATITAPHGINAYNAQTVSTREGLGYDHIRREWGRTHEMIIKALEDLPIEKYHQGFPFPWGEEGTVAYLVEIFVKHEEEHAEHLHEWLKDPNQVLPNKH
jgi:hypothetical protein